MRTAFLLAFTILMAGCQGDGGSGVERTDAPRTLALSFTLEGGDGKEANPGPHCGSAYIRDGSLWVERSEEALDGPRPLLFVDPHLSGDWATAGSAGYAASLPFPVPTGIPDETDPVLRVEWRDGAAHVNGKAVALPHPFVTRDPQGEWTARGTLSVGPSVIRTFQGGLCA